jgi:hypothetical protein
MGLARVTFFVVAPIKSHSLSVNGYKISGKIAYRNDVLVEAGDSGVPQGMQLRDVTIQGEINTYHE